MKAGQLHTAARTTRMSPKHLRRYVNESAGRHNIRPMDTINRRAVGADSARPPGSSVRADTAPFTRLDPTMPPTSFDIGFSLNPCPRKPGAPHAQDAEKSMI